MERLRDLFENPGIYRSEAPTIWLESPAPRPVVFVSGIGGDVEQWTEVLDIIHEWSDPPVVIAGSTDPAWVEVGHFDGLSGTGPEFGWAEALPEGAWFVPVVNPGRSAERVGEPDTRVDREQGRIYEEQWTAAVSGRDPALLVIESFNRWTQGTQIEPAAGPGDQPPDREYSSYEPLSPTAYLELTRALVDSLVR
jgi:hypothetical protein